MDLDLFAPLLAHQRGVVTRRQLIAGGAAPHDLRRWERRRDLSAVLPGVWVTHTGVLSPEQRDWAAVLWAQPAALALTTAVRAAGGRAGALAATDLGRTHILIERGRRLIAPDWVTLHWCQALQRSVLWSASPPRQREEDAALDIAIAHLRSSSTRAYLNAVGALAEPIQARRTTAARMAAALDARARVPHRAWLAGVITEIGCGTTTVLEHGYVRLVERPHGLPAALLQVRQQTVSGQVVRDGVFSAHRVLELDGRAFHQGADRRDHDLERDLDSAVTGLETTRLGWGQIYDRPCQTAGKLGLLLAADGWRGEVRWCGPACSAQAVLARSA